MEVLQSMAIQVTTKQPGLQKYTTKVDYLQRPDAQEKNYFPWEDHLPPAHYNPF